MLFVAFFLLVLYGSFAWVLNCKPSTFSRFGSYRIGRSTVCSQGRFLSESTFCQSRKAAGEAGSDGRTARRPRTAPKLRCDSGGGEGPVAGPQSPPAPACDFPRHARPRSPGRRPVLPTAGGWTAGRGPAAAGSRLGTICTRREGISGNKPAGKRCRSERRPHSLPGPHSLPAPVAAPDRAPRRALADRPAGDNFPAGGQAGRKSLCSSTRRAGRCRAGARPDASGPAGPAFVPTRLAGNGRVSAGRPAPLPHPGRRLGRRGARLLPGSARTRGCEGQGLRCRMCRVGIPAQRPGPAFPDETPAERRRRRQCRCPNARRPFKGYPACWGRAGPHDAAGRFAEERLGKGPRTRSSGTGRLGHGLQTHGPRAGLDVTVQSQHHRAGPG